jgi:hypothetical protein
LHVRVRQPWESTTRQLLLLLTSCRSPTKRHACCIIPHRLLLLQVRLTCLLLPITALRPPILWQLLAWLLTWLQAEHACIVRTAVRTAYSAVLANAGNVLLLAVATA